jgi:hypothetical protein
LRSPQFSPWFGIGEPLPSSPNGERPPTRGVAAHAALRIYDFMDSTRDSKW